MYYFQQYVVALELVLVPNMPPRTRIDAKKAEAERLQGEPLSFSVVNVVCGVFMGSVTLLNQFHVVVVTGNFSC